MGIKHTHSRPGPSSRRYNIIMPESKKNLAKSAHAQPLIFDTAIKQFSVKHT